MSTPVNNIALILSSWITKCKTKVSGLQVVYDDDLSYETSVKKIRALHKKQGNNTSSLPLFSFRRSPLKFSEPLGIRGGGHRGREASGSDSLASQYKTAHGTIEVTFNYISKNLRESEAFEIGYLSKDGIRGVGQVDIPITGIGTWQYSVEWGELESKTLVTEENRYNLLSGTVSISGWLILLETVVKDVDKIVFSAFTTPDNELLFTEEIIV